MRLPNGTTLMHGTTPYDPAKAHEYYMRTRKLTGRKKGQATYSVRSSSGRTVTLTSRELTEQKAYAAKRIVEIKKSLNELTIKLKAAMRIAKEKQTNTKRESAKPPSAADKSKAARESKKYQDKHKAEIATKRTPANKTATTTVDKKKSANVDPVAQLQTKIIKITDTLIAVVARQRALTGATRNN